MRPADRAAQQVRPLTLTRNYTKHAEGSVLVEFGDTKVLCTATVEGCSALSQRPRAGLDNG